MRPAQHNTNVNPAYSVRLKYPKSVSAYRIVRNYKGDGVDGHHGIGGQECFRLPTIAVISRVRDHKEFSAVHTSCRFATHALIMTLHAFLHPGFNHKFQPNEEYIQEDPCNESLIEIFRPAVRRERLSKANDSGEYEEKRK